MQSSRVSNEDQNDRIKPFLISLVGSFVRPENSYGAVFRTKDAVCPYGWCRSMEMRTLALNLFLYNSKA